MAELATPLMTRFEMARLADLEKQGIPLEEAKNKVYAERGPSGQPRSGPTGPASAPGQAAKPTPVVVVNQPSSGLSPWWGILAVIAVVVYFGSRQQTVVVEQPAEDMGDIPTGAMSRPRKR
jgi:hypothetical protein